MRSDVVRPARTADRAMGRDRNRSTMPSFMSSARPMAVLVEPNKRVLHEDARHQELHVVQAGRQIRELIGVDVPEQQHEHDGLHQLEDEHGGHPGERDQVAPGDQEAVADGQARRGRRCWMGRAGRRALCTTVLMRLLLPWRPGRGASSSDPSSVGELGVGVALGAAACERKEHVVEGGSVQCDVGEPDVGLVQPTHALQEGRRSFVADRDPDTTLVFVGGGLAGADAGE